MAAPPIEIIPRRRIGPGLPSFIVAEIGINHNGSIDMAKQLIQAAKEAGADCVKLQKSCLSAKFTKAALQRPYQSANSFGSTYGQHKCHLEFSNEEFRYLQSYAETTVGIPFSASGMDETSIDFLADELGVPFLKVGSGDVNNLRLIKRAALKQRPLIISTGMADINLVQRICRTVKAVQSEPYKMVLLQCTSAYPTEPENANLKVIETYRQLEPNVNVGYSGHEEGFAISIAAVTLGACVIERHLTLDKTLKGSDHRCSLEPKEFAEMIRQIRLVESALGDGMKSFLPCERPCFNKLGKSVVLARRISKGHVLAPDDLCIKVAEAQGYPAENIDDLVGRVAKVCMEEDDVLMVEKLEDFNMS